MSRADEELDRLADLLNGIPVERDGMTLSELDGYVAALIVCPEMIPPSEWLSVVWGGEGAVADIEEAEELIGAVMGHYNRLARELAEDPEAYAPGLGNRSQQRRSAVGALGGRFRTGDAAACRCLGGGCPER